MRLNKGFAVPKLFEMNGNQRITEKTIAVLPFVNMSDNLENEYFSDGITEEIINALAKIKQLKVTSRTSSFYFKNKNIPISEIGKELNVSSILEGSVRLSHDTIRITAQLINVANDYHFWSETWDRKLENIFAIQDEISLLIADKLRERFGHFEIQEHLVIEKTSSIEAYENYLKGMFHFSKWNQQDAELGIEFFKKSIELDPNYADSHSAIAGSYVFLAATGFLPAEPAFIKAKKYANDALKLDAQIPYNYVVLGGISLWYEWDFEKAISSFQQVLKINPSYAEAYYSIAVSLMVIGRKDLALNYIKIAIKLDPLSINHQFIESWIYYMLGNSQKALEVSNDVLKRDPAALTSRIIQNCCLLFTGRHAEVIEYYEDDSLTSVDVSTKNGMLGLAHIYNKDTANKNKCLELLHEQLNTNHAARAFSFIYIILAASGETEKAVSYLEKGLLTKSPLFLFLIDDPLTKPILEDKRYKAALKKTFGDKIQLHTPAITSLTLNQKKKPLLDNATKKRYSKQLIQLIETKTPYLESNLTLRDLAALTSIHPNHLSWLLNDYFGKSFNDFINHYRLEAFKSKVIDSNNAHITLIGLAYESGFNSKSAFNYFFKKETGLTPTNWIKSAIKK